MPAKSMPKTTKIERIGGQENDFTRLHYDADDRCVWLDTDIGHRDGLVVGVGDTKDNALMDAIRELHNRLCDLQLAAIRRCVGIKN